MKRLLSNIIKEEGKQVGTLYHYTSLLKLKIILRNNELMVGRNGVISFTRDQNFNMVKREIGSNLECRLEIDGDSLSNNYKIEPYNDEAWTENDPKNYESEEIVKKSIYPIIPYILKIVIYKDINNFSQQIKEEYGIKVEVIEKEFDPNNINYKNPIPEDFIEKYKNNLDWDEICLYQKLSEDFMRKYQDKLNWDYIAIYQNLSEPFIREFDNKFNFDILLNHHKISQELYDELSINKSKKIKILSKRLIKEEGKQIGILYHFTNINKLKKILDTDTLKKGSEDNVSFTRNKNFNFIKRNIGSSLECRLEIDGDSLSNNYKIEPYNDENFTGNIPSKMESEEIVKENISPIIPYILKITLYKDIDNFSQQIKEEYGIEVEVIEKEVKFNEDEFRSVKFYKQPLTEDFIRKNVNKLSWTYLTRHQTLSENIMRDFQDKLDWDNVSMYQNLSETFIREFQGKLHWGLISMYQKLSEPFIKEFKNRIIFNNLYRNENIILSPEFKKELENDGNEIESKFKKRLIKSEISFDINYNDELLAIYKNPTLNEISEIKKNDPYNSIRGIIYSDGTIYAWGGEILHKDMAKIQNEINVDGGCRFHFDPSWGFDFDFNRRFTEDEVKEYIKQFEFYLNQFGNLQSNDLYLWGIEGKGKGPFKYTYDELFSKILIEV